MDTQEKRIKDAMEKAKISRGWAARDKKQDATLAIAYSLSAIAEQLSAIDKTLTFLTEVLERKPSD